MSRKYASRSRTTMQLPAFRRILVAVGSPEDDEKSVGLATTLAVMSGSELILHHISAVPTGFTASLPLMAGIPVSFPPADLSTFDERERSVSRWMATLVRTAEERGVRARMEISRPERGVAEELTTRARDEMADLIVMSSKQRGSLDRLLLGSTSAEVVNRASCPVLVVP
jgi:nucleotide-binding universal stress UspA family protein